MGLLDADETTPAGEATTAGPGGEATTTAAPMTKMTTEAERQDVPTNSSAEENPSTPSFAPMGYDQSYVWMMQLVILVATMTLFFPFLRKLIGIKPKKRQVVNYTSYDSDVCDDDEDADDCNDNLENEECCDEE